MHNPAILGREVNDRSRFAEGLSVSRFIADLLFGVLRREDVGRVERPLDLNRRRVGVELEAAETFGVVHQFVFGPGLPLEQRPPSRLLRTLVKPQQLGDQAPHARIAMPASAHAGRQGPLVFAGRHHPLRNPGYTDVFVPKIPNAQLHVFENAAHMANIECADEFNARTQAFLNSIT
jgi:pimeloyl-ACP methyl ester carboxylesterase